MASTKRISTIDELHPAVRAAVQATLTELKAASHPFELFETYRTPQRQASLYAQGRTKKGPKVTNAGPWSSYHQYGLAADFVLFIGGNWSWNTSGANKAHWEALHKIGRKNGLEPLSWELPHLQLMGTSAAELRKGIYPPLGDDSWAENLSDMIDDWTGGGSPPKPPTVSRPPLSSADTENEDDPQGGTPSPANDGSDSTDRGTTTEQTGEDDVMVTETFSKIQAFIDKWEGGYVNHPSDPGGPTNMGITQATLARWRGRNVSVDDVKNLTREEQRRIMKAYYYDIINGDQLPPPIAAVTYNAAILHGTKRAGEFLQTALNRYGAGLKVDGVIGQKSIGAATITNAVTLASDYITVEMAYLRALKTWPTFGLGWTNRLNDMKMFAAKLASISDARLVTDEPSGTRGAFPPAPGPDDAKPIGPIGGLLGQTVGKALDGKKTNLGIAGLILSAAASIPAVQNVLSTAVVDTTQPTIAVASAVMMAWGLLSKLEKEIRSPDPTT